MLEEFIIDQPVAYTIVKKIVKNDAIAHAYLIETGNYYRGFDFAIAFAKSLLCPKKQTKNENCGDCTQCYRIDNKNFSELETYPIEEWNGGKCTGCWAGGWYLS